MDLTGVTDPDDAERVDLIRRRVINVVGHELRTPFTTLRGLTDRLPDAAPEEIDELAPAIARLVGRLDDLLRDLLIASGVSTAEPVGAPEPIDLDALVDETWADRGGSMENRSGRAGTVEVEHELARGILDRLADNTLAHGSPPQRVECEPGQVRFVSNASDLATEDVDQLFEMFYRGEAAVMNRPGIGVGLPISRALARRVGGDVEVTVADGVLRATVRFAS